MHDRTGRRDSARPLTALATEPTISVIVPVYNGGGNFQRFLASVAGADPPPLELIVVSDGDTDGSWRVAEEFGARVLRLPINGGPARARNRGASLARGGILMFLDADIAVQKDIFGRVAAVFNESPDLAAVFGSYDSDPADPNFLSQYKNLLHHYIYQHQGSSEDASIFWTACGAVRREVFTTLRGFDERFRWSQDVEFGYRLRQAGHRIRLCKDLQVQHLKRWSAPALVRSDLVHHAVPMAGLILSRGMLRNDLHTRVSSCMSVGLLGGAGACLFGAWWRAGLGLVGVSLLCALLAVNAPLYRFLWRKRGPLFALGVIPWHWIYYLSAGLGFLVGLWRHIFSRPGPETSAAAGAARFPGVPAAPLMTIDAGGARRCSALQRAAVVAGREPDIPQSPSTASGGTTAAPLVSVIVPCYNSERSIRTCLAAIRDQCCEVPFDVTVVDSSADRTPHIVEGEFPWVRLIRLARRTFAGAARNVGIRATAGPLCLMIDSDCVAAPDLVARMIARHREADYAAVGGSLANGTPWSPSGWVGYLIEFKDFMPAVPLRLERSVPTANVTYRRTILERYGGFDERMRFGEDILFNWKITAAGERILFDPAIRVTHLNRTGWRQVLSYQVGLGRFAAVARRRSLGSRSLLLRHPVLLALMPFARVLNAARWLGRHDRRALLPFIALWPLYLAAAASWSLGFRQGARADLDATQQRSGGCATGQATDPPAPHAGGGER